MERGTVEYGYILLIHILKLLDNNGKYEKKQGDHTKNNFFFF